MRKKNNLSKPPEGIFLDYQKIFSIGIGGELNEENISEILEILISHNLGSSSASVSLSREELIKTKYGKKFISNYVVFRECGISYPITPMNWSSGERIPGVQAEESALSSIVLCFQGHYKPAFYTLREVIELVTLQLYFLISDDRIIIGKWGRSEIRTPLLKNMFKELKKCELFKKIEQELKITEQLYQIYDELGGYVHTRGIPATNMGLSGTNFIEFSKNAFERYLRFAYKVFEKLSILYLSFFPTGIISLPAFQKFGYFDPVWIPRKEKVSFIRSIIPKKSLIKLEQFAEQNHWFLQLRERINALPDLSPDELDKSYDKFMVLSKDIELFKNESKRIDFKLFIPFECLNG